MKLDSSRGLLSLSKEVHPRMKLPKQKSGYTSNSDTRDNEPLGLYLKASWKAPPRPHEGEASHVKKSQLLPKSKREPVASGRTKPAGVPQQKKKVSMQPFARSPKTAKGRPKTPFDGRRKQAKYGSIQEQAGVIHASESSSDHEREESDFPGASSGAEVKGDTGYVPSD
jgi:hypothetical protein